METFTVRLNTLKREKGAKQNQIADFVGVSPRAVKNWLEGVGDLSTTNFFKLCEFFGVSADYLWFGKDRPTPPNEGSKPSQIKTINNISYKIPSTTYYNTSANFEPRIHEKDLVLLDHEQIKPVSGAVYLFQTKNEDFYLARYYYAGPTDKHYLLEGSQKADEVAPLELPIEQFLESTGATIVGRVVGRCTSDI